MDEHRFDDFPAVIDRQPPDRQSPEAVVSPRTREAHEVFNRELPRPLEERPGQWVAYHGAERIGFAETKEQVYQDCLERGLPVGEVFVGRIEPERGDVIIGPGAIWDVYFGPSCNPPDAYISPLILEAHEVYDRELPRLLEERPGQWVAYHGPRRIGFASTKEEIYRACREQGLKDDELLVDCIEPPMGDISFGAEAILDFFSEG